MDETFYLSNQLILLITFQEDPVTLGRRRGEATQLTSGGTGI